MLAPVYAECFSTETLKTRNLLLIVSFVLILSAVGLIAFSKYPTGIPSIGISVTITSGMRWVLLTLCCYLFVLHSTRSYNRLRKNHESKTAFERDALETRLHNAMETCGKEIDAPELKVLKAKLDYLTEPSSPQK